MGWPGGNPVVYSSAPREIRNSDKLVSRLVCNGTEPSLNECRFETGLKCAGGKAAAVQCAGQ